MGSKTTNRINRILDLEEKIAIETRGAKKRKLERRLKAAQKELKEFQKNLPQDEIINFDDI